MNPISPWVKIFIPLLIIVAVLFGVFTYGAHQFGLGKKVEQAACLKRDNADLTHANAKLKSLEEQYRKQEHDHSAALAYISSQYQKDLAHVKADKDRVISGLRDGSVRLRILVASTVQPNGGAASAVTSSTAGRDGETRAELSVSASEFLVGLASEADEVTKQLGRCQDVINADRDQQGKNDGRK
jgi:hypothetical protein